MMVLTMYFKQARSGAGFFCAYSAERIKSKVDRIEGDQAHIYTCDHVIPKSFGNKLNFNPRNLQALSWAVNDKKGWSVNLHAQVKAAQLGLSGIGIAGFRDDFDEMLYLFDMRVNEKNEKEALTVMWPWLWREPDYPFRPFIPAYDEKAKKFFSLEESVQVDESIRAGNMIEWRKTCKDAKKIDMVWGEYQKRYNMTPEQAAR